MKWFPTHVNAHFENRENMDQSVFLLLSFITCHCIALNAFPCVLLYVPFDFKDDCDVSLTRKHLAIVS